MCKLLTTCGPVDFCSTLSQYLLFTCCHLHYWQYELQRQLPAVSLPCDNKSFTHVCLCHRAVYICSILSHLPYHHKALNGLICANMLLRNYSLTHQAWRKSSYMPRVGPGCVLCPRIDPLRFLAGCRRRRLNQGLVVAFGFFSLSDRACICVIFFSLWVHAVFSSLSFCYQYQCN